MPRIAYNTIPNFKRATWEVIDQANKIADRYKSMGFNLTLRQLYYQFISIDFFPNSEKSYDRLGTIINNARLAGMFDWDYIQDRGREAYGTGWDMHETPTHEDLIRDARWGMSVDLWEGQERRIEVWVEKQALEEVVQRAADTYRVGYFACKGYVSQSEMWAAGQRLRRVAQGGQAPLIIHLGDHDPSGIDMSRDIEERLSMFAEEPVEVKRIALNMNQIDQYNPPPNPAKVTDSRFAEYASRYGRSSWELDALRPEMLVELIRGEIRGNMDYEAFSAQVKKEDALRVKFDKVASRWDDIVEFLNEEEEN